MDEVKERLEKDALQVFLRQKEKSYEIFQEKLKIFMGFIAEGKVKNATDEERKFAAHWLACGGEFHCVSAGGHWHVELLISKPEAPPPPQTDLVDREKLFE